MDLVVRRLDPGPGGEQGIGHPAPVAGVNMPATTTVPVARAIRRTPSAHGPSRGSASGASGVPKQAIDASGKTTTRAPASAARRVHSSMSRRFFSGSGPVVSWLRAIRMVRSSFVRGQWEWVAFTGCGALGAARAASSSRAASGSRPSRTPTRETAEASVMYTASGAQVP